MSASRRPWHVFVREEGPHFTFASEAAAWVRAQSITRGDFIDRAPCVDVWCNDGDPFERVRFHSTRPTERQRLQRLTPEQGGGASWQTTHTLSEHGEWVAVR